MNNELFCYDSKEGDEILVLLHGNGESSDYFKNQIEYFKDKYRIIAPDTRGHGKSPMGKKPFTLEQFAEDLRNLLDSLQIQKVTILGFSDGGNIALIFAMRYPEYIKKLIVCGANIFPEGLRDSFLNRAKEKYPKKKLKGIFSKKSKKEALLLSLMLFEPNIKPSQLSVLSMPVLVMAGKNDIIKAEHTKLIAENIKNSTLLILEGTHQIIREIPEQFNKAVDEWLLER